MALFGIQPTSAQDAAEAERQLRLQQEQLEAFRRQQQERQRERTVQDRLQLPPEERYQSEPGERHCFPIYSLEIRGDGGLLSKEKQDALSRDFFGFCIGTRQISQLVESLTRHYFELGYVTTRIYLPQQDLGSATLRLEVVPGTVESLQFADPGSNRHLNLSTAMPLVEGEVFNLRELEQGLDQLNRLSSNNASVKLAPGEGPGASRVLVDNSPARRHRATLGYDNSGSESTGENQRNLLLEWDSPLGLNDYSYLYYQGDTQDTADGLGSESASLHYSIPFRYWTYSLGLSQSEYLSTVAGFLTSFESSGVSRSLRTSAERLVYRDQQNKIGLQFGLVRKKSNNFIEDVLLETSSRTLSAASLGGSWQWYGPGGSSTFAELVYHRGLKQFGALEDGDGGGEPRAQFDKYTLNLNYRSGFSAWGRSWYWHSGLRGQYSPDRLYSSEQFTLGTGNTVRGYKNLGLSGDSGVVATLELGGHFPVSTGWFSGTGIRAALGVEAGDVGMPERGKQSLKSWYGSLFWSGRRFRLNLTYAEPLAAPGALDVPGQAVYGSLNWMF